MPNNNKIEEIIRDSLKKSKDQKKEHYLFGRILVYVKDPVLPNVDMSSMLGKIESLIPPHLMEEVDEIFIGSFGENEERELEAHYESGAIYIASDLPTSGDYIENIVHETAHAVEAQRGLEIYGDKKIEQEFLGKRERLAATLESHGIDVSHLDFLDPDYTPELDSFLYKEIGYDNMHSLTMGLFSSPYGVTSLREYFANGFEEFFLGNREFLKRTSPELFSKLMGVILDDI
tara:strand:+ start:1665 stop:2360 length:696 start_codon:yes stop_codon:yes gene_type:complete